MEMLELVKPGDEKRGKPVYMKPADTEHFLQFSRQGNMNLIVTIVLN